MLTTSRRSAFYRRRSRRASAHMTGDTRASFIVATSRPECRLLLLFCRMPAGRCLISHGFWRDATPLPDERQKFHHMFAG